MEEGRAEERQDLWRGRGQTASHLRNGLINTIDREEEAEGRDGGAVERGGLIEIILTSSSNLFRGKQASDS